MNDLGNKITKFLDSFENIFRKKSYQVYMVLFSGFIVPFIGTTVVPGTGVSSTDTIW